MYILHLVAAPITELAYSRREMSLRKITIV